MRGHGRARTDHAADPGNGDRPVAGLVLPDHDPARGGHDHRSAARHDGSALVRAARKRPACGPAACSRPMRSSSRAYSLWWWRRSSAASARAGHSCRRFRSTPPGSGRSGRRACFFAGNLLVGAGFCVYCIDVLEQTTATYGGLAPHARSAFPPRTRARRRRRRRQSLPRSSRSTGCISCAVGCDDPGRLARPHLRPHGRHRRPRRQEPRLFLSATRSRT